MKPASGGNAGQRILVVLPNWVGDVVLATPVLAALRAQLADAYIAFLGRRTLEPIVDGGGWHDAWFAWPQRGGATGQGMLALAAALRRQRFDVALLLPNSFRVALLARLAGIPRRVGYARDGRSWLLTDRLRPLRRGGEYVPTPITPYYGAIAERIGCRVTDWKLRLGVTPQQQQAGAALARRLGLDQGRDYAVLVPGAAFGSSKCWPAERFAELARRLESEWGLRSVLAGSPEEQPVLEKIAGLAGSCAVCCTDPGMTLGSLKPLVRDARLLVTNDTGPRHYGNAFNVPTVTIFGPTHPQWTETGYTGEVRVQVPVECGPCQLPRCPLDHRCMTQVTVDMVLEAAREALRRSPPGAAVPLAAAGGGTG